MTASHFGAIFFYQKSGEACQYVFRTGQISEQDKRLWVYQRLIGGTDFHPKIRQQLAKIQSALQQVWAGGTGKCQMAQQMQGKSFAPDHVLPILDKYACLKETEKKLSVLTQTAITQQEALEAIGLNAALGTPFLGDVSEAFVEKYQTAMTLAVQPTKQAFQSFINTWRADAAEHVENGRKRYLAEQKQIKTLETNAAGLQEKIQKQLDEYSLSIES